MNTPGKGLDRAVGVSSAFIVDALAFDATLLVGDSHCGFSCSQELGQGGCCWDQVAIGVTEGDVLDSERDGAFLGGGFCVFTNTQEIIEGNVDEVSNGFPLGAGVACSCPELIVQEDGLSDGYRDCQLRCGGWVRMLVAVNHSFEGSPVDAIGIWLVEGVGEAVQFKGLSDG